MTSAYIRNRIKKGLAKTINKTGSPSIDKVYLMQYTVTGGGGCL